MTTTSRRTATRIVLALMAGAVLVLGPSAAIAQTPSAPTLHHASMCPNMDDF